MPSRRRSRERALQILYLWDVRRQPVEEAIDSYYASLYSDESPAPPERDEFVQKLVCGSVENVDQIDGQIARHADVVVSGGRAFLFYFTHPQWGPKDGKQNTSDQRRSSIQVAELHLAGGEITCDRNAPTYVDLKPPEDTN
jgi:hypothetical protein